MNIDWNNPDPVLLTALYVTGAVTLVLGILTLIAAWRIYVKGGERGWKVLIPIMSRYAFYKIVWDKNVFWADLLLESAGVILLGFSGGSLLDRYAPAISAAGLPLPDLKPYLIGSGTALPSWCCLIAFILLAAVSVIRLIRTYKLSKSFDHGFLFFLCLLFFPIISLLVLGFGKHQFYVGPNRTVTVENMERIR